MISLKKYLDMDPGRPPTDLLPNELLAAVVECYGSALVAVGTSGARAFPTIGAELQQGLARLAGGLARTMTPSQVKDTERQVEEHLLQWEGRSAEYFKAKTDEVKELLITLAGTAESMGERDQRVTQHFNQFTSQLQTIGRLEDLGQIRASLVRGTTELKTYVDQMAQEGKKSVERLRAEVSTYETKLQAAEQLALQDALTGMPNRRNLEERIEISIARKQAFCVSMFDLNNFKQINDTYGHQAGDNLLKQFGQELRSQFRGSDIVGRWGGDEFLALLDGDLTGARSRIEQMHRWVFGEYTIQVDATRKPVKARVDASVGVAQWQPGDTVQEIIHRADAAMYKEKELARKSKVKQ